MKGYIYKIINKESGKFYVGSTINVEKRKKRHFSDLKNNRHHCISLQRAYNKYGQDAFDFSAKEVLICDEQQLRILEERYIGYCWKSGKLYNTSKKACGGDLITYHPDNQRIREKQRKNAIDRYAKMSTEERKILSESMKGDKNPNYGNHWTEEMRKKSSDYFKEYYSKYGSQLKGKTYEEIFGDEKAKELKKQQSERAKKRVGDKNPFFGKQHTKETKEKLSRSRMGKKNLASCKKVLFNNEIYESASECAKKTGMNINTVAYRCRKHIYGFSYVGENDALPQKKAKKMWTLEECDRLASECKTIKEFNEKYPHALTYLRAHKGEYEKIKTKYFTKIRTYWSIENVIEIAKKYNSYKDFRETEQAAYSSTVRNKWIDEVKKIWKD